MDKVPGAGGKTFCPTTEDLHTVLWANEVTAGNLEQVLEVAETSFGDTSHLDLDAVKDTKKTILYR